MRMLLLLPLAVAANGQEIVLKASGALVSDMVFRKLEPLINDFLPSVLLPPIPVLFDGQVKVDGVKFDKLTLHKGGFKLKALDADEEVEKQEAAYADWQRLEREYADALAAYEAELARTQEVNVAILQSDPFAAELSGPPVPEAVKALQLARQKLLRKTFYFEKEPLGEDSYADDRFSVNREAYLHDEAAPAKLLGQIRDGKRKALQLTTEASLSVYGVISITVLGGQPWTFPFRAEVQHAVADVALGVLQHKAGESVLTVPRISLSTTPGKTRLELRTMGLTLSDPCPVADEPQQRGWGAALWAGLRGALGIGVEAGRQLLVAGKALWTGGWEGLKTYSREGWFNAHRWLAENGEALWDAVGAKVWGIILDAINGFGEQTDMVFPLPLDLPLMGFTDCPSSSSESPGRATLARDLPPSAPAGKADMAQCRPLLAIDVENIAVSSLGLEVEANVDGALMTSPIKPALGKPECGQAPGPAAAPDVLPGSSTAIVGDTVRISLDPEVLSEAYASCGFDATRTERTGQTGLVTRIDPPSEAYPCKTLEIDGEFWVPDAAAALVEQQQQWLHGFPIDGARYESLQLAEAACFENFLCRGVSLHDPTPDLSPASRAKGDDDLPPPDDEDDHYYLLQYTSYPARTDVHTIEGPIPYGQQMNPFPTPSGETPLTGSEQFFPDGARLPVFRAWLHCDPEYRRNATTAYLKRRVVGRRVSAERTFVDYGPGVSCNDMSFGLDFSLDRSYWDRYTCACSVTKAQDIPEMLRDATSFEASDTLGSGECTYLYWPMVSKQARYLSPRLDVVEDPRAQFHLDRTPPFAIHRCGGSPLDDTFLPPPALVPYPQVATEPFLPLCPWRAPVGQRAALGSPATTHGAAARASQGALNALLRAIYAAGTLGASTEDLLLGGLSDRFVWNPRARRWDPLDPYETKHPQTVANVCKVLGVCFEEDGLKQPLTVRDPSATAEARANGSEPVGHDHMLKARMFMTVPPYLKMTGNGPESGDDAVQVHVALDVELYAVPGAAPPLPMIRKPCIIKESSALLHLKYQHHYFHFYTGPGSTSEVSKWAWVELRADKHVGGSLTFRGYGTSDFGRVLDFNLGGWDVITDPPEGYVLRILHANEWWAAKVTKAKHSKKLEVQLGATKDATTFGGDKVEVRLAAGNFRGLEDSVASSCEVEGEDDKFEEKHCFLVRVWKHHDDRVDRDRGKACLCVQTAEEKRQWTHQLCAQAKESYNSACGGIERDPVVGQCTDPTRQHRIWRGTLGARYSAGLEPVGRYVCVTKPGAAKTKVTFLDLSSNNRAVKIRSTQELLDFRFDEAELSEATAVKRQWQWSDLALDAVMAPVTATQVLARGVTEGASALISAEFWTDTLVSVALTTADALPKLVMGLVDSAGFLSFPIDLTAFLTPETVALIEVHLEVYDGYLDIILNLIDPVDEPIIAAELQRRFQAQTAKIDKIKNPKKKGNWLKRAVNWLRSLATAKFDPCSQREITSLPPLTALKKGKKKAPAPDAVSVRASGEGLAFAEVDSEGVLGDRRSANVRRAEP